MPQSSEGVPWICRKKTKLLLLKLTTENRLLPNDNSPVSAFFHEPINLTS